MASINRVVLVGNLTRDIELRSTPSGKSVATLRMAVNRRWRKDNDEKGESTDYFNVVVWDKLAELCNEYIGRGSPVAVDGRLQSRSWETQEGQKRSIVEVVAENVQFLSRPGGRDRPEPQTTVVDESAQKEEVPATNEDIPF